MLVGMIVAIPAAGVAAAAPAAVAASDAAVAGPAARDVTAPVSTVDVSIMFRDSGLVLPRRKIFPVVGLRV